MIWSLRFPGESMSFRERLRQFIKDSFFVDEIEDDQSFLETGVIDSLGVLQIVSLVESETATKVPDIDLVPENFDSIARIVAYVERLRQAA
jgi:acyl carrier protein